MLVADSPSEAPAAHLPGSRGTEQELFSVPLEGHPGGVSRKLAAFSVWGITVPAVLQQGLGRFNAECHRSTKEGRGKGQVEEGH